MLCGPDFLWSLTSDTSKKLVHTRETIAKKKQKLKVRKVSRKWVVQELLAAELPQVPRPTIEKYVKGLLQQGFDTKRALQLASVLIQAGMAKGHALQCEDVWCSSSSSSSSCSSNTGSEDSSDNVDS